MILSLKCKLELELCDRAFELHIYLMLVFLAEREFSSTEMFYWERWNVHEAESLEGEQNNLFIISMILSLKCKLKLELCDWAIELHINACFPGQTWVFLRCLLGQWMDEFTLMTPVSSLITINCKADYQVILPKDIQAHSGHSRLIIPSTYVFIVPECTFAALSCISMFPFMESQHRLNWAICQPRWFYPVYTFSSWKSHTYTGSR